MEYSNFKKIEQVTKKFSLLGRRADLFEDIKPIEASAWLLETLKKSKLVPLRNEKVKSERIVSPILMEIAQSYQANITLFSGEDLLIDVDKDLSGECDFFFTLVPQSAYLETPVISLVEAKDEDMDMVLPSVLPNFMEQNFLTKWKAKIFLFYTAVPLMEQNGNF